MESTPEPTTSPPLADASSIIPRRSEGDDPHIQLIESLRSQITDLHSQVSLLNGKLVQSYDRVSDLDDTLHVTSANLRSSTLKISELEIERSQHLDALNTGLLVERGTITTELTRLMERVTEETAQRGLAESAKQEIEKDLDDLSANLFNQANTMVAEARYARAMSERKAEEAQRALKGAEEAISIMQMQMQNLSTDNEAIEQELVAARQRMEKGKWIADDHSPSLELFPKLSTAHLPYQEFLLFNSHLRSIRTRNDPPPLLSNFVHLAFITRLQIEDSDPTLRLDFAPSLNFLTRRSVQSAVLAGQLTVEPMATSRLSHDPTVATPLLGSMSLQDLTCALCGKHVFAPPSGDVARGRRLAHQATTSWANTSRFIKAQLSSTPSSVPSSPISPDSPLPPSIPPQTYVFRLALPPPTNNQPQKPSTTYPLCHNGFCLKRLRSTCELWHFVRKDIVAKVWSEPSESSVTGPPPPVHPSLVKGQLQKRSSFASLSSSLTLRNQSSLATPSSNGVNGAVDGEAASPSPPLSSRKSVAGRVGSLWSGLGGALGSRSSSPTPDPTLARRVVPPLPALSVAGTDAHKGAEVEVRGGGAGEGVVAVATSADLPPLPPRHRPPPDPPSRPRASAEVGSSDPTASGSEVLHESAGNSVKGERETLSSIAVQGVTLSEESNGFKIAPECVSDADNTQAAEVVFKANTLGVDTSTVIPDPSTLIASPIDGEKERETPKPPAAALPDEAETKTEKSSPVAEAPASVASTSASVTLMASATTSSAPPPLPRRAAARSAGSHAGTTSPPPSRSGTPAPPSSSKPGDDAIISGASTEDGQPRPSLDSLASASAPRSSGSARASADIGRESVMSGNTDTTPSIYSSAMSPGSNHPELPAERSSVEEEHPSINATLDGESNSNDDINGPALSAHRRSPARDTALNSDKVNGSVEPTHIPPLPARDGKDTSAIDSAPSWEEVTWRELVRLREEMFWSRMGATSPRSQVSA